jgi:putative ABC transport system substrate-binding protein
LTRGSLILALTLSVTCGVGMLEPSPALAAEAAQRVARLGFVAPYSDDYSALWERLRELGWVEGKNLIIEARYAEGHIDRLPALMSDVVARRVDVIVTAGTPAAVAAKNATATTPIVDAAMGDPVGNGLAASLARPGGNVTGLSSEMTDDLGGKWLELLQETVPRLSAVAVIANPDNPLNARLRKALEAAALMRHLELRFIEVRERKAALDRSLRQAHRQAQAILVLPDPFTFELRRQIATRAATYRLPDMYVWLGYLDSGGLMGYGVDPANFYGRAANYVDKILRGAKPADLPIEQPTKHKLVVNLKTAKALGITIPESILLRADEVIR